MILNELGGVGLLFFKFFNNSWTYILINFES